MTKRKKGIQRPKPDEEESQEEGTEKETKEIIEKLKETKEIIEKLEQKPLIAELMFSYSIQGYAIVQHCETTSQAKDAYKKSIDSGDFPAIGTTQSVSFTQIGKKTFLIMFQGAEFSVRKS